MAVLGKRKAPEPAISDQDAHDIFRRHFEARFNPLPAEQAASRAAKSTSRSDTDTDEDENEDDGDADEQDSEQDSEWGGVSNPEDSDSESEEDEAPAIEVVDHSVSQTPNLSTMSKRELKAFMSSRPPDYLATSKISTTALPTPSSSSSSTTTLPEDAPSLLAQDLELRRLLAESHLFKSSSSSSNPSGAAEKPFTAGRIRQKTTDMRIQALGSTASILKQDKMPMHMRKGITAAATAREAKRRREAKENGVILEREQPKKKKTTRGGDAGRRGGQDVGRPGVGRMRGATLKISESDVKRIEGVRDTFGRKGRR